MFNQVTNSALRRYTFTIHLKLYNVLNNFFLLCSGVDLKLIDSCSNGEQNKYAGIGATVFFTAVMATLAASYALFTVFDNIYTSIFFGIIWGLLIFNLDRFIVSTIKKNDSKWKEFLQAVPRIILAIIITVVISKLLELKIFEKEINQVLLTEKNQMTLENKEQIAKQFTPEIAKIQNGIHSLKDEITTKEKEVNELYNSDVIINEKVYSDIQEDEDTYAYKRQKAKELMQKQADAFYKKQSKLL